PADQEFQIGQHVQAVEWCEAAARCPTLPACGPTLARPAPLQWRSSEGTNRQRITESQDFVNRVPGFCRLAAVLRATREAGTGTLKERYRHSGLNIFKKSSKKLSGPVAQWSELAAHNRLVAGSSPAGPTICFALRASQDLHFTPATKAGALRGPGG